MGIAQTLMHYIGYSIVSTEWPWLYSASKQDNVLTHLHIQKVSSFAKQHYDDCVAMSAQSWFAMYTLRSAQSTWRVCRPANGPGALLQIWMSQNADLLQQPLFQCCYLQS